MTRLKRYFFVFGLLTIFATCYIIVMTISSADFLPVREGSCGIGVMRMQLAAQLAALKTELEYSRKRALPPSQSSINTVDAMLRQIDSTFSTFVPNPRPDICPEVYTNSSYGYPRYLKGWLKTDCKSEKPLSKLLTVLINPSPEKNKERRNRYLERILFGLRKHYPDVRVIVADRFSEYRSDLAKRIEFVSFDEDVHDGKVWNKLISKVVTRYVFLGRNLNHFNWFARFERQISVFAVDERVKIVGGASRNLTGHWQVGCLQTDLKNFALEYSEGYFSSKNECMFCDHLLSSFAAKTDFLKRVPFDEDLPNPVVFEDFFLRIKASGAFVLNCPDIMHFSTDPTHRKRLTVRESWIPLVQKWQLNFVTIRPNVAFKYSCKDSRLDCGNKHSFGKYFLLPPCCIEEYARAWKFFAEFAEKNNISYEIMSGSLLGAVKMVGVIPWDIDGDLDFLAIHHSFVMKSRSLFEEKGFSLSAPIEPRLDTSKFVLSGGEIILYTPNFPIEMWGEYELSMDIVSVEDLPEELRFPTKVNLNGAWVYSNIHPGLYSRNRYGREYLRHANSWRHTGGGSSWDDYKAGHFVPCPHRGHHACLDRYFSDGNFQFLTP